MDGCRYESNCPLVGPGTIGGVPSVGVFLRYPSPYLREFRRKPRKTPNGWVDKRDRGLNLAPPVFQFWALPLCHWWGADILNEFLGLLETLSWEKYKWIEDHLKVSETQLKSYLWKICMKLSMHLDLTKNSNNSCSRPNRLFELVFHFFFFSKWCPYKYLK